MISLKKDFNKGVVSLKINLLDDLWYLSHIILPGDIITSKTERKIKIGDASTGNVRVVRKTIVLSLRVESVQLLDGKTLRTKGVVTHGPEDVPHGSYHSFGLTLNDSFTLFKSSWPKYLRNQLSDAINNSSQNLLIVIFDREQAFFSKVAQTGIKHLSNIKASVQKKQYDSSITNNIYGLINSELKKYFSQLKPAAIIFASPSFWKQNMKKSLSSEMQKISFFTTTNVVDSSVVSSLLSRPELHSILLKQRVANEQKFVDLILEKLSKNEVSYGFDDLKEAAISGAISSLGITSTFIKKSQEEDFYSSVDNLIKTVDKTDGSINIIQSPQLIKIIDGLGGIVGILRWKQ